MTRFIIGWFVTYVIGIIVGFFISHLLIVHAEAIRTWMYAAAG